VAAANFALGILPVAFIVATSQLLGKVAAAAREGVSSQAWGGMVLVFGLAAAVFVVQLAVTALLTPLAELMARRVDGEVIRRLMSAALATPSVALVEDPEALNQLSEASYDLESGFLSPGRACAGHLALIARYVQLAGLACAVGLWFSWWAAAGVLATVLLFRYGQRGGLRKYSALSRTLAQNRRRAGYLRELGTATGAGKEIRVFGLAGWIGQRHREAYLSWMLPQWAARRRIYLKPFIVFTAIGLLAIGSVAAALGAAAAAHRVDVTQLALVIQALLAAVRLGDYYPEADVQTQLGTNAYQAVLRFEEKAAAYCRRELTSSGSAPLGYGPRDGGVPPGADWNGADRDGRSAVDALSGAIGLRFTDTTFTYPGRSQPVLSGLDLEIPAGQPTALVGLNGAGKTTVIKLLARLYEPESGSIQANGTDIRDIELERWRRQIAVIFQDFVHYEASLADNVAFGAVEHPRDRAAMTAVLDRAGLSGVVARLRDGLDTPLSRHLPGGADLSGGEWQRVAIARALYALEHGAGILVLDEPTANLDARAEISFYQEFIQATAGVTTILISNRLASVRLASNIVVLEDGHVLERGSHEELLRADGRYATLFALQASRFTGGQSADGQSADSSVHERWS
jgi:ATP-binding cassette subfamily B protein